MSMRRLEVQACEMILCDEGLRGNVSRTVPRSGFFGRHILRAVLTVGAVLLVYALPAQAQQYVPCEPEKQRLLTIPELVTQKGVLRGTIMLSDEKETMLFREPPQSKPGDATSSVKCSPQYVRILRGLNTTPSPSPSPSPAFPYPMPGPTLRARVGDIIQLTFINQINPGHFSLSMDRGRCDEPVPPGDVFPDCFHGSSTGNIHFHGTHTNPNRTGDNVFIEVRPLPRDNPGNLVATPEQVQKSLDKFYAQCETRLKRSALLEWPRTWADMPADWTAEQKLLLQKYEPKLWAVDADQLKAGGWPQYYVGAFPYCFRLPEYKEATWPPKPATPAMGGMQMGASSTEQVAPSPIMGQAPGTHWYHAHKHGSTAIDVANGMTGAFIIEGQYDDDLNTWYGDGWTRAQPILVLNQLGVTPNLLRGGQGGQGGVGATDKGPNFSVNGQTNPVIEMRPGEVKMWRIVNTAGRAGAYFLAPPQIGSGYEWRQIAQDGVQFNDFNYHSHHNKNFLLAAGNRADLLVKAQPCPGPPNPKATCDYPVYVQNEVDPSDLSTANKLTLLTIHVSGPALDREAHQAEFIPEGLQHFPAFLTDISGSEVTGGKVIRFASTPPVAQHTINGVKFDGTVGALVQLNKVEEWKIVNETYGPAISHPFHIHINPFQVVEVFDPNNTIAVPDPKQPGKTITVPQYVFDSKAQVSQQQCLLNPFGNPEDWKPCGPTPENKNGIWWDVFPIPSGIRVKGADGKPLINPNTNKPVQVPGYFKMRSRFVDYSGYYVIHCHILAHEDRGMMTVVEVYPAPMPYIHQ